jgi:hypothetical protein
MKETNACAMPNYETLYKDMCIKYEQLRKDYKAMETEFIRMRAQLDIVYLIFGGK